MIFLRLLILSSMWSAVMGCSWVAVQFMGGSMWVFWAGGGCRVQRATADRRRLTARGLHAARGKEKTCQVFKT